MQNFVYYDYEDYDFDVDQKAEILAGIEEGIDISAYAKPEFLAIQMRQIRLGIKEGLDVSVYCKEDYDWFQMEEIRKGMMAGIDYKLYANPEIDYKRMRQIRKGLKQGIDLTAFVRLDAGILEELRKAVAAKVSIVDYIKEGYNVGQLEQIRLALEKKLDIRPYIGIEFLGASIREIALGLEKDLPVSEYASMEYGWQQMREIRLGMEERLDVSQYSNSLFSWQQMREIRLGLEEGIDVTPYRKFMYIASDMEKMRNKILMEEAENIAERRTTELSDDIIAVFVSSDEMEACVELKCESDIGITERDVLDGLKRHGICAGLLHEEIEKLIREKKYKQTIIVARGQHSQKGEDGWYEFFFNTNPDRKPKVYEDGTVDYRDITWFELVTEGQKIAFYHEAKEGEAGYTVTGKVLKARKGREKNVLSGKGFVLQADKKTYISTLNGKIELCDENRIEITRMCVLANVNLATGNVSFDGTVYVKGNVGTGSAIYATECVVVDGYVEGALIKSDKDVLLRQGMNGGGSGMIEAAGNVAGQFFEATRVIAGGDISAHYCLNCELRTEGIIDIKGKKGLLAGGIARAARGVNAYNVGNKAQLGTVLNVGIDNQTLDELRVLEIKIENVQKELTILNHAYLDFQKKYTVEVRNAMSIYLKIEDAIYTKKLELKELNERKQQLEQLMEDMKGAKIVVKGVLYEGTEVIIDNFRWKARGLSDVTIKCKNRKIVLEAT